jgi:hypothetical protein
MQAPSLASMLPARPQTTPHRKAALTGRLRKMRVNGSIMIYASNGDREPKLPVRDLMQKNLASTRCHWQPSPSRPQTGADRHRRLDAMPGRILSVSARFPLDETAAAHKAVEAGGKVGHRCRRSAALKKALRSLKSTACTAFRRTTVIGAMSGQVSFVPGLGPGIHEQPQTSRQTARLCPGQARPRRK